MRMTQGSLLFHVINRMASCFCQMIERFVSSVPYVFYTYLQLNSDSIISLLFNNLQFSSYLNSLRYLLDIPLYGSILCDVLIRWFKLVE